MSERGTFVYFDRCGYHKGFYNDDNYTRTLSNIEYAAFDDLPDDIYEFPCLSAHELLCGSCHYFALSLKNVLGYDPYVIEEIHEKGFHAFCQIYRNGNLYYIDARGITSSFDEFMEVAGKFVKDKYIIRPVNLIDIEGWERGCDYNEEAYAFAEYVINQNRECYIF